MRFNARTWALTAMVLAGLSAPLQADLVAYYNFDGEVEDSSGNGNHPSSIQFGTFNDDVPSQIGSGSSFDMEGGPGGFFVPDSPTLDFTTGLTIAGWVNMSATDNYYFIGVKGPSGDAPANYPGNFEFRLAPGGGLQFGHQFTETTNIVFFGSTGTVPALEWHHIALTLNGGTGGNFYIDGVNAGSFADTSVFGITNDNPLIVGTRADGYSNFNGWMDDLAFWNEPLKSVQIAALADGASPLNLPEFDTADINSDGVVDLADYGILRDNFGTGTTFEEGDIDGNGTVDGLDFRILKSSLGGPAAGVPEPSSVILVAVGALVLAGRRMRRAAAFAVAVVISGASFAQADVVLQVNPFTGATTLVNQTGGVLSLDNYSIRSNSASLDASTWTSLADAATPGWEEANPTSRRLSELNISGATSVPNNGTINLGPAFRPNGYHDAVLQVVPAGSAEFAPATIEYVGSPTPGTEYRLANVSIAEVSSQLGAPFERAASHIVDGSGVDYSAGTHTIAPDNFMWLTAGVGFTAGVDDFSPFVTFDLGSVVDLTDVKIWNYNEDLEGRPELLGRGVNEFTISVATDAAGPFTLVDAFALDKAPGLGDVDFSESFALNQAGVRYVRFDIQSNHNGVVYPAIGGEPDAAFAGLSEVQFFARAGESGVTGDTDGDGDVDLDDLNNVRNNFGGTGPVGSTPGDTFPFDGNVDLDDLNGVRNNFGTTAGSNSVPEPGTLVLALGMGISALAFFRNRS